MYHLSSNLAALHVGQSEECTDVTFPICIAILSVQFSTLSLEVYEDCRCVVFGASDIVLVGHVILHFLLTVHQHLFFFLVEQLDFVRQTYEWQVEHVNRVNLAKVFLPEEEVET